MSGGGMKPAAGSWIEEAFPNGDGCTDGQLDRLAFVIVSTDSPMSLQRLEDEMTGRGWNVLAPGRFLDAKGRTVISVSGFNFRTMISGTKPERIYIAPLTRMEREAFVDAIEQFATVNDVEVVDIVKTRKFGIKN